MSLPNGASLHAESALGHVTSREQQLVPCSARTLVRPKQRLDITLQHHWDAGELGGAGEPAKRQVHEKIVTPLGANRVPLLGAGHTPHNLKGALHAPEHPGKISTNDHLFLLGESAALRHKLHQHPK
jgi:hypothetical protein